jgi:hypothetical protein
MPPGGFELTTKNTKRAKREDPGKGKENALMV